LRGKEKGEDEKTKTERRRENRYRRLIGGERQMPLNILDHGVIFPVHYTGMIN